jgi:hypothetical protein
MEDGEAIKLGRDRFEMKIRALRRPSVAGFFD